MIRYSDVSAITQLLNTGKELFMRFFIPFLLKKLYLSGGIENGENVYEYDDDDMYGKNDV
jgi:hypothetical protein